MIGARDIARAARACAHARRGFDHRADHLRMLPHAEVVIRAPDDDVAAPLWRMPDRVREAPRDALEVREYAIAPLLVQAAQRIRENGVVVHSSGSRSRHIRKILVRMSREYTGSARSNS